MAGYVEQRGENKYRLVYMLKGTKHTKTIKIDNVKNIKKDKNLQIELANFVNEVEKGTFYNTNYSLREFSQLYLSEFIKPNCSHTTLRRYLGILNYRIFPILGNYNLNEITPIMINSFMNEMKEAKTLYKHRENTPLKKRSIEKIYEVLSAIMQKAFELELIITNPCKRVKLNLTNIESEIGKKEIINSYTREEFKKVLELLKDEKLINKTLIEVALKTGLRRSEIFGLTWNDIDFNSKTLTVNKARHYVKGQGMVVRTPKTKSSIRTISIPNSLIDTLKEFKIDNENNEYLFENKSIDGICSWFKQFQIDNNINVIRFHDLRHTHASILLLQGVDIKTISERLGHSNISITMNTYAHVLKELDQNASELIDKL